MNIPLSGGLRGAFAHLPHTVQQEARRFHFARQLRRGTFRSSEPEYRWLDRLLRDGDWTIDVGANVGHYTSRMSALVGPSGRVFAYEPVPDTFELLAANTRRFPYRNVTLLNAGAGDRTELRGFSIPDWRVGYPNYYRAHIEDMSPAFQVLICSIDALCLPHPVTLIKIDVEGATEAVFRGAMKLLERDRPTLLVEGEAESILPMLAGLGYTAWQYPGSPNVLFCADRGGSGENSVAADGGAVRVCSNTPVHSTD